jgi:multidrug resistance efflux pump
MSQNSLKRFRQDLVISETWQPNTQAKTYLIQDPDSGETFEFGEEEFFLCQSFDGRSTPEEIISRFENHFGFSIAPDDFEAFRQQIVDLGLLEVAGANGSYSFPVYDEDDEDDDDEDELGFGSSSPPKTRLSLIRNSPAFFRNIAIVFQPFELIFKLIFWALVPLSLSCCFLWLKNNFAIEKDLIFTKNIISFLGAVLIFLLSINLFTKFVKAVVGSIYGATVTDFGIQLRWGFVPRFYSKISGIRKMSRKQQMWLYGSPLIFRIVLFVVGTFVWYWYSGKGNTLSAWGIFFAQLGLLTFINGSLPIRLGSPGTKLLCVYLNKSANYPRQIVKGTLQFFRSNSSRNAERLVLSSKEIFLLLVGTILLIFLSFILVNITIKFAVGLAESFPNIFGRGTVYIILVVLAFLALNYFRKILFAKKVDKPVIADSTIPRDSGIRDLKITRIEKKSDFWLGKIINLKTIFLFALVVILCLPVPYTPGGPVLLLPPKQQQLQAPVSGQIARVFFNGGDGKLIKAKTVVAQMIAADIQNEILTIKEQIRQQEANLQKEQVNTNKLLAGPRQEELDVSKTQVEVAREQLKSAIAQVGVAQEEVDSARALMEMSEKQVEVAKQQLESAVVTSRYSKNEAERLEEFYKEGVFPLQRLEDARESAETAQINIEQNRQNLAAQEKNLEQMRQNFEAKQRNLEQIQQNVVTSQKSLEEAQAQYKLVSIGFPSQDIEVARQQVEAARAELRRLQQELKYAEQKNSGTDLIMPLDGYLLDSYLNKKIGSYLNQGDTFATVQDDRTLLGELQLPEYDAGEIKIGVNAELKLLAYPNEPIDGKVVSIEPATSEETYGRVFKILIEPNNNDRPLKPGMSGYGKLKLGEKPIFIVITRPIIRFIQIELWSWLP